MVPVDLKKTEVLTICKSIIGLTDMAAELGGGNISILFSPTNSLYFRFFQQMRKRSRLSAL